MDGVAMVKLVSFGVGQVKGVGFAGEVHMACARV